MCLAIPLQIERIEGDFAYVQAGALKPSRRINIQMLPGIKPGDYVMVHAGFAIQKLDVRKAKETLRLIDEVR